MPFLHPGRAFLQRHGPISDVNDVLDYVAFLKKESNLSDQPPIQLEKIFNHFDIPKPKFVPLPNQEGLLLDHERGIIIINSEDPSTRQRFSEAHELIEFLFEALASGKVWAKGWVTKHKGEFNYGTKENLCNQAAADLLMPPKKIEQLASSMGVSFETAIFVATGYQVSRTAALIQLARNGPGRCWVVLWRMKHKPSEIRNRISDKQLSLFGNPGEFVAQKKLRVEWVLGNPSAPFIPRHKSIEIGTLAYAAWSNGIFTSGTEYLNFNSISGWFRSENLPFHIDDETFVISLFEYVRA